MHLRGSAVQDWPGRQKFYNDGKFVMQRTWLGAFRTIVLVFALEGLFLGLVAWRLNTPWDIIAISSSYVSVALPVDSVGELNVTAA